MENLFHGNPFNRTDIYNMHSFNDDISRWDTSNVTTMYFMFSEARAFNGDISRWDTSSVTTMEGMFCGARSFNGDLSRWDISNVTYDMVKMFYGCPIQARANNTTNTSF